jgi:hypothetical protein
MRNEWLGSLAGLLASAGLLFSQPEGAPPSAPPAPAPEATAPAEAPAPAGTGAPDLTLPSAFSGGDSGFGSFGDHGPHYTVNAEYIFWVIKTAHLLPPLLRNDDTPSGQGDIDLAGGTNGNLNYNAFSGARFGLGYWWGDCPELGVEGRLMFLGRHSLHFNDEANPVLVRPFVDVSTGSQSSVVVGFPGLGTGGATVDSTSEFWGLELSGYFNLVDDTVVDGLRLDALAGLRYLELNEDFTLASATSFNRDLSDFPQLAAAGFAGNQLRILDTFLTRNRYTAGHIGLRAKYFGDLANIDFRVKLAMGTNEEQIKIDGGQQRILANGTSVRSRGGLLALPSNIGRFNKDQFAFAPELEGTINVPFGHHINLNLGYNFIGLSRVVRPGDQIDTNIDSTQIPNLGTPTGNRSNLPRPSLPYKQTKYYAHGFNIGLEFCW